MMARTTRKILDMALVSMEKVRPVVSKCWVFTKNYAMESRARPLVTSRAVQKIETSLDILTDTFLVILKKLRDRQLPAELKYLEQELDAVKKKLNETKDFSCAAKTVKSFGATSWKYLKVEAIPPFSAGFFNGPAGQKFENFVGKVANGFINTLAGKIKQMDDEAERARIEMLAAIKAREEKLKAEAKKKEEENKKAAAIKAAEETKKAKAKAEQKKTEVKAAKPKDKPKDDPKSKAGKKEKPKKKPKKGKKKKKGK